MQSLTAHCWGRGATGANGVGEGGHAEEGSAEGKRVAAQLAEEEVGLGRFGGRLGRGQTGVDTRQPLLR